VRGSSSAELCQAVGAAVAGSRSSRAEEAEAGKGRQRQRQRQVRSREYVAVILEKENFELCDVE